MLFQQTKSEKKKTFQKKERKKAHLFLMNGSSSRKLCEFLQGYGCAVAPGEII